MLDAAEIDPRLLPAVFESPAICARVSTRRRRPHRPPRRHADRRRRRRSGGRGDRHGHHAAGRRERDDRDVRRGVCGDRSPGHRSEGTDSYVLSRDSRTLARDGGDAGGRPLAAMVPRSAGRRRLVRPADRGGRARAAGRGRRALGAVPDGRTHAALRSERPRRARRPRGEPRPRPHRPRDPGRRGVQPARYVLDLCRVGRTGRAASGSAAADRAPRSGVRFRPTSTGSRSIPPQTRERHTARRFWPPSALASGQRWMRRAMLWSAASTVDDASAGGRHLDERPVPRIQAHLSRAALRKPDDHV